MLSTIVLLTVLAQQPQVIPSPPISGAWIGEGERLTLTLTKDQLTLTRSSGPMTMAFKMDGSVSRNVTKTAAGTDWRHESTARWVGNAILIVTKTTRENGASWESLSVYSLDVESGNLKAVTVDYGHEGGDGMITRTKIYQKTTGR